MESFFYNEEKNIITIHAKNFVKQKKLEHYNELIMDMVNISNKILDQYPVIDVKIEMLGASKENFDPKFIKTTISLFYEYFPNKLNKLYIFNLPKILEFVFDFVNHLLDAPTRKKIIIIKKAKTKKNLQDDLDDVKSVNKCLITNS